MSQNYDEWLEDFIKKYDGVGKEKPTPAKEPEAEEPDPVVREEDTVSVSEEDDEMQKMISMQQEYEESLEKYPMDHPKQMFSHNFMRSTYLPVTVVKGKKTEIPDLDEVAEELVHKVYSETTSGKVRLAQTTFCRIWYERFGYVECNGIILTPQGAITEEWFNKKIISMIAKMGTEHCNIDTTAMHILNTYMNMYYTETYLDKTKIPFRNGDLILNTETKSFTFYEGYLSPVPYRFDYDFKNIPNCLEPEFPNFKSWRDGLFDEEDQYSLKQMLGYLLIPSNEAQEAFFIVGKGGSGKSILTDCIIPRMLGKASFRMSISTFFNDKFQLGLSEGKLCMIDDDIGEAYLSNADSGRFKNFITSDTIQIEKKYHSATQAVNVARIVCCGNHMINSADKSDGFTRRLHVIYAKPRTIDKVDRRFKNKVSGEISMIVLWALEGLLEMLGNGGVPYRSERTETGLEYYAESQKWEEQFINDCFCYQAKTVSYISDVKDALDEWSKENSELCGEGTLTQKYKAVTRWLQYEGAEKNGYIYKRGLKRGDKYNARGYVNMALRKPVTSPDVFYDETGNLKIRLKKRKPEDQDKLEK